MMNGKIHFLNTGHSDCIILESKGHIAMFDAAEDTDYPPEKPNLKADGYEDIIVDYLFKHFKDENGKVNIDFILGTHAHSDHLGGFDTVLNNPDVTLNRAYLKPYHEKNIFIYERTRWDNDIVYQQTVDAVKNKNAELIQSFDEEETTLGDFKFKFYNGKYKKPLLPFGENVNSVVTLVQLGKNKIVLAGDINYKTKDEKIIADKIGKVNLLKVAHHGYAFSTSKYWVKKLLPEYAVVCNWGKAIYPDVRSKLINIANAEIYATADVNGVMAIVDDNSIKIETDIM